MTSNVTIEIESKRLRQQQRILMLPVSDLGMSECIAKCDQLFLNNVRVFYVH